MKCANCGSARIRRSLLRAQDWQEILDWPRLKLQYPIRCQRCGERWFVSIRAALKLPGSLSHRTWRSYYFFISIAVSLAVFFAAWEACIEAWGERGWILGWIPSGVLSSLIMMLFVLGRGLPKSDRSN